MNRKTRIILSVVAGAAVCAGVVYAVLNIPPASNDEHPNSNNSSVLADRVDIVYFHRTVRCSTCLHAENITRYTVEEYFADELASGKVTFQSINVEDEANAGILEKYGAPSFLTLGINTVINGTDNIETITDIWYVGDEEFVEILKGEIEQSLAGET